MESVKNMLSSPIENSNSGTEKKTMEKNLMT